MTTFELIDPPARYRDYDGEVNPALVFDAICKVLSDRADQVDWADFSPADWQLLPQMARMERVGPLLYWYFSGKGTPHSPPTSPVNGEPPTNSPREQGESYPPRSPRQRGEAQPPTVAPQAGGRATPLSPPATGGGQSWPPGIPKETAAALMGQYYATLGRNTQLFAALDEVLAAFEREEIPVILLKGAAFLYKHQESAQTVYPNIGLRPMGDLDLLVKKADIPTAVCLLNALGYWKDTVEHNAAVNWEEGFGHHIHLINAEGVVVELHWNLIGGDHDWRTPDEARIWAQAEPLGSSGIVWQLNPAWHWVYLCAHLALQHGLIRSQLIWLYDLAAMAKTAREPDWQQLTAAAERLDWSGAVAIALAAASQHFGLIVPAEVQAQLAASPSRDRNLVAQKAAGQDTRAARVWRLFSVLSPGAKLKLAWAYIFPAPAYIRKRYRPAPAWLWPLYYVYRWGDVGLDVVRTVWRRVRPLPPSVPPSTGG